MTLLILVMLNIILCTTLLPTLFLLTCSIQIPVTCGLPAVSTHLQSIKQCGFWSDGLIRSQLIWMYSVFKKQKKFGFSRTRVKKEDNISLAWFDHTSAAAKVKKDKTTTTIMERERHFLFFLKKKKFTKWYNFSIKMPKFTYTKNA